MALALPTSIVCAVIPARAAEAIPHAFYVADYQEMVKGGIRPYSERVESTFKLYSGRYVVRGGEVQPLEGDAPKGRMVVIEFDSLTQARAWYDSPEYSAIRPIRQQSGKTNAYIVEGSVAAPHS
jgi:uncharacterized protein (DUF1330 family)